MEPISHREIVTKMANELYNKMELSTVIYNTGYQRNKDHVTSIIQIYILKIFTLEVSKHVNQVIGMNCKLGSLKKY